MRHPDRIEYRTDLGALPPIDPSTLAPGRTAAAAARGAIAAAWGVSIAPGQFDQGNPMMTTDLTMSAQDEGRREAEADNEADFQDSVVRDLRPPGSGPVLLPGSPEQKKIAKLTGEITEMEANHPAIEARIVALEASSLAGTKTEEQLRLEATLSGQKARIAAKRAEITQITRSTEALNDPFSRAKRQAEVDPQPTAWQAFRWALGGRPDQIGAAIREGRDASSRRGITERRQRMADRHAVAMGHTPVHGSGVRDGKERRDAEVSAETSYNKLASTGTVIEWGGGTGNFMFVQDVGSEGAVYTQEDGTTTELYYSTQERYVPGAPTPPLVRVQMDEAGNIIARDPGKTPKVCIMTPKRDPANPRNFLPDPARPGHFIMEPKDVDLTSRQVKDNIHQGEEMVTLGKLFTPEEAELILQRGESSDRLAPIRVRLDDLIVGLNGDPSMRAIVQDERNRVDLLSNMLTWQYVTDVYGNPIVGAVDTRIPVLPGQPGHFVRPLMHDQHRPGVLSYPEQRQESNVRIARDARVAASKSVRAQQLDGARPPRRKRRFWD